MPRVRLALTAAATFAVLACAPAHADIFAATEVHAPGSRSDFDIEVVNATTGAKVALPAGVNTSADELHPSISTNGKRLAYERKDSAAGTVRIIVADLSTGQTSDLYTGFEASQLQPDEPAISPNGTEVLTGGSSAQSDVPFFPTVGVTPLAPFPDGPYQHSNFSATFNDYLSPVRTDEIEALGPTFVSRATTASSRGDIAVSGPLTSPVHSETEAYGHPAVVNGAGFVLLDARPIKGNDALGNGDIDFTAYPPPTGPRPPVTPLPGVNTSLDESQPASTSDGRYVAFVRHETDHHDHLLVWDSQTQTILNPDGVDLGPILGRDGGNVSLYTRTVLLRSQVALNEVAARLSQGSGLGILVQRIVGRHKVLGREEFRLRKVGKVPLGHFGKGRHRIHWKLRIGGKRLKPGRYLLTLRTLNRHKVVTGLARPTVVRIRPQRRRKKH